MDEWIHRQKSGGVLLSVHGSKMLDDDAAENDTGTKKKKWLQCLG